jgi:hypothetical protein
MRIYTIPRAWCCRFIKHTQSKVALRYACDSCSRLRKYIDISYQLVLGIVRKDKHRVTQSIAAAWSSKQASITQARTDSNLQAGGLPARQQYIRLRADSRSVDEGVWWRGRGRVRCWRGQPCGSGRWRGRPDPAGD